MTDANEIIERRACITGVGQSEIGRRLYRDPLELTLDGCVAAGLANHVLCFRSVWEGSAQGEKGRSAVMPGGGGGGGGGFKAQGFMAWNLPFTAPSASIWIGMFAQRHFYKYGTTKEQMAWI